MIFIKMDIKDILRDYEFLLDHNVGVEISMYDVNYTDKVTFTEVDKIAKVLRENKIEVITHLPIYSLDMGTKDKTISNYSRDIIIRSLDISAVFGAKKAVFHLGYNPLHPRKVHKIWFRNIVEQYKYIDVYARALDIKIAMENVWESDGYPFQFMQERFSDIVFCFDIGHSQVYLNEIDHEEFIKEFGNKIKHIHVHDNKLLEDDHLHIGDGKIDFDKYFGYFNKYLKEFTVTLETNFDIGIINDIKNIRQRLGKR